MGKIEDMMHLQTYSKPSEVICDFVLSPSRGHNRTEFVCDLIVQKRKTKFEPHVAQDLCLERSMDLLVFVLDLCDVEPDHYTLCGISYLYKAHIMVTILAIHVSKSVWYPRDSST